MSRLFAGTPFDIPPTCDLCGKVESDCECTPAQKAESAANSRRAADRIAPEKQTAKVSVQKRKAGRVVTVIEGLTGTANDLPALLSQLKSVCGAGGTVKADEDLIELQGDHSARVRKSLAEIGYRVK